MSDVSFFVASGERIAVLGHNGSGKSTLVKILGGLQSPSEGMCLVKGNNIQEMDFRELRGTIGMVFQDPENQIVAAMVEDDVAFAPENQGLPSQEIQARVDASIGRVNMLHKQGASVAALSGGEKQRTALAGALAAKVECLILDEATAMLDPKGRLDIERALREIHAEGMTIIQVTHQIEAENFDDIERVIVLSGGRIVWQGSTGEFWGKAEYLGFDLPDEFKVRKFCREHNIKFPDDLAKLTPSLTAERGHHEVMTQDLAGFILSLTVERGHCDETQDLANFIPSLSTEKGYCDETTPLATERAHHPNTNTPANFTPSLSTEKTPAKFRIEDLSFRYDENSPYALKNINADIMAGQWLSIIGRTGSGKSTLVQHLNALYKIQEGKIFFDDLPLAQKGEEVHTLRQKVGLVFQHPEDQLFSPTVREELAFAPKNAGFRSKELDDAIIYGLECSSLGREFLDRNPIALSGGERRLVAIASVLSAKPECIVLDEPLAGLDASYQKKILNMLGRLCDEGKTVITISHDLNMALNCSDRILILRDASKVSEGEPDEVIETLMDILEPEAWPDVLRLSNEIRKVNKKFPLLYDYQEFISCISQI